jgi:hypothetical protein
VLPAFFMVLALQLEPSTQTALDRLAEAKQALDAVSMPTGDAANWLANLRRDFQELQTAFVAQSSKPAAAALPGSSVTGETTAVSVGSSPQPVGTSGTTSRPESAMDWRTRYSVVDGDLIVLLGPSGVASPRGSVALDATTQEPLLAFRSKLEQFYATALGQTPSSPGTRELPQPQDHGDSALFDRIERMLNEALGRENGRGLESAGKVTMSRAEVNEILANLAQLKAALRAAYGR